MCGEVCQKRARARRLFASARREVWRLLQYLRAAPQLGRPFQTERVFGDCFATCVCLGTTMGLKDPSPFK